MFGSSRVFLSGDLTAHHTHTSLLIIHAYHFVWRRGMHTLARLWGLKGILLWHRHVWRCIKTSSVNSSSVLYSCQRTEHVHYLGHSDRNAELRAVIKLWAVVHVAWGLTNPRCRHNKMMTSFPSNSLGGSCFLGGIFDCYNTFLIIIIIIIIICFFLRRTR